MTNVNYFTGTSEQQPNALAYLSSLQELSTQNVPESQKISQDIDLASYGLQSMDEYQLMVDIRDDGGTVDDFREILEQYRLRGKEISIQESEEDILGEGFISETGEALSQRGENIVDIYKRSHDRRGEVARVAKEEGLGASFVESMKQSLFDFGTAWQAVGQGAGAIGDIVWEGVENAAQVGLPKEAEVAIAQSVNEIGDSEIVQSIGEGYLDFREKNPETARNIEASVNIASIFPFIKPIGKGAKAVGETTVKAGSAVKGKLFPAKSLDDIVLEVSQGKKSDIPKFKKALQSIEVADVDNYENLAKSFDDKIKELSTKQDSLLPSEGKYVVDDLVTKQGDRQVNFVKNALDDLEEVGMKETDLDLLSKVDKFKAKELVSEKDINDLARFYGSEFKTKSFTKAGEPKSSVSAARFENTRKGLKDKSRSLLADDSVKVLDDEMSNLFASRDLAQKMATKVDDLTKKIEPRNFVEAGFRKVADAIDFLTLGGPKAFLARLFPSNVGVKVMNSLDIQNNLSKNLKLIEKAMKDLDNAKTMKKKASIIEKLTEGIGVSSKQVDDFAKGVKDKAKGKDSLGVNTISE